jgi:hypothetical protein
MRRLVFAQSRHRVDEFIAAFNRKDIPAALACFTDDAIYHDVTYGLLATTVGSRAGNCPSQIRPAASMPTNRALCVANSRRLGFVFVSNCWGSESERVLNKSEAFPD